MPDVWIDPKQRRAPETVPFTFAVNTVYTASSLLTLGGITVDTAKPKRPRRRPNDPTLLAEKAAKANRRQDGKPSVTPIVPEPLSGKDGKKYTVTLPPELHRRFAMHAADTGQTMLQVLSGWIRDNTKSY